MFWTRSGDLIVMAVLGGMGTVFGPVIGAVALLVLEEALLSIERVTGTIPGRANWQLISGRCCCWSCCSRAAASTACLTGPRRG